MGVLFPNAGRSTSGHPNYPGEHRKSIPMSASATEMEVPREAAEWIQEVVLGKPHGIVNLIMGQSLVSLFRASDLRAILTALAGSPRTASNGVSKSELRFRIRHLLFDDYPVCQKPKKILMRRLAQETAEKRRLSASQEQGGGNTTPLPTVMPTRPAKPKTHTIPPGTNIAAAFSPTAFCHQQQQRDLNNPYYQNGRGFPPLLTLPCVFPPTMPVGPGQLIPQHAHWGYGVPPTLLHFNTQAFHSPTKIRQNPTQPLQSPPQPRLCSRSHKKTPISESPAGAAAQPRSKRPRMDLQYQPPQHRQLQQPQSHQTHQIQHQQPPVFVKPESAMGDPDSTPSNPAERSVCAQLQQNFGFTDPYEMLSSYRRLKKTRLPSVEDVMIDIVTAREEADEAKKMDEARRQSEHSRKEDAKRRREAIEQERRLKLESSTVRDLRTLHFPNSWILKGRAAIRIQDGITEECTSLKRSLIQLLELELKARKWYGATLPSSYFCRVLSSTLYTCDSLADAVNDRVEYLQKIMFQLSEQTKSGVPIAFREAYDADAADDSDNELVQLSDTGILTNPVKNIGKTPKTAVVILD